MYLSTVSDWLHWIATLHPNEIDLGLERVKTVGERLGVLKPNCPVITVGGTNGKGSTVAGLEAIYLTAGYKVGAFTSPILFSHNDYVRINGKNATDENFCQAYAEVETARLGINLTPFEFYTLGALLIFKRYPLDIILLEVGLGGRLDAVNIVDPDLAIITSISLDHTDRLGNSLDLIALEKAGIMRPLKPAICGDLNPPASLRQYAASIDATVSYQGQDFRYDAESHTWSFQTSETIYTGLPFVNLHLPNLATVLMATLLMQKTLPVAYEQIKQGLARIDLPGRIQIVPGRPEIIFDVAHNPAAVTLLTQRLQILPLAKKTYAIFSMLVDKDILSSILHIKTHIDEWFIAPLSTPRAATLSHLKNAFQQANIGKVHYFANIAEAYAAVKDRAEASDRVLVFGSFHTVKDVWPFVNN